MVFPLIEFGTFAGGTLSLHPFLHRSLPLPPTSTHTPNFISEHLFHLLHIKISFSHFWVIFTSSRFIPLSPCFTFVYFPSSPQSGILISCSTQGHKIWGWIACICVCPHVRSHIGPLVPVKVGSNQLPGAQVKASLCQNEGQKAQTPTGRHHPTVLRF